MKVTEIHDYLSKYPKTDVSGVSLGCWEEIIRTTTIPELSGKLVTGDLIVEKHYEQIKEFIAGKSNYTIFIRSLPDLVPQMDGNGEIEGYAMRTRIQYGENGKCITQEQYDHIHDFAG